MYTHQPRRRLLLTNLSRSQSLRLVSTTFVLIALCITSLASFGGDDIRKRSKTPEEKAVVVVKRGSAIVKVPKRPAMATQVNLNCSVWTDTCWTTGGQTLQGHKHASYGSYDTDLLSACPSGSISIGTNIFVGPHEFDGFGYIGAQQICKDTATGNCVIYAGTEAIYYDNYDDWLSDLQNLE